MGHGDDPNPLKNEGLSPGDSVELTVASTGETMTGVVVGLAPSRFHYGDKGQPPRFVPAGYEVMIPDGSTVTMAAEYVTTKRG